MWEMVSNGHCVHTGPMTQRRDDTQSGLTIPTRAEGMASENALGKISPGEKEEREKEGDGDARKLKS